MTQFILDYWPVLCAQPLILAATLWFGWWMAKRDTERIYWRGHKRGREIGLGEGRKEGAIKIAQRYNDLKRGESVEAILEQKFL